jgi:NADPH:quinone reductase-like Zn-dependent oxidoreductase
MSTAGGFGQYIRVPAGWVMPLPRGLTARQNMARPSACIIAAMKFERAVPVGIPLSINI